MAKRKNSTALFEVIHSDVRFASAPPRKWSLRLPRLRLPGRSTSENAAAAPAISEPPPINAEPRRTWNLQPLLPRLGMSLDPDRHIVHFQLSYTTALVAAFALVLIVALSYVTGKHSSRRNVLAVAEQTTDELRSGPAQAGVLDVTGEGLNPVMASAPSRADGAQVAAAKTISQPTATKTSAAAQPDMKRHAGLQYVIIQSYPEAEKQYADEAAKLLNNNGVPCTVETNLSFAPHWFCVVGMTPFDHTRNSSEYDEYIGRIERIGKGMSGTSKFVKKFEPHPFAWKDPKPDEAR